MMNGDRTVTGTLGIEDRLEYGAADAGLNERGKGVPTLGKVRCKGQSTGSGRSMPHLPLLERSY